MQGLVYLTDTPAEQGAFAMVPDLYRTLDQWLAVPRSDAEARRPDVSNYPLVPVGGPQGSVVIWHRQDGAHQPRQQLDEAATGAVRDDDAGRLRRVAVAQRARMSGEASAGVGDPPEGGGQLDPEPGPPPRLTALGARLAGVEAW